MNPASDTPELVEGSKVSLSPQCWEKGEGEGFFSLPALGEGLG
jgi:hypothetical protein